MIAFKAVIAVAIVILIRKFAGVTASWTAVAWFRAGPGATTLSQLEQPLIAINSVKARLEIVVRAQVGY